MKKLVIALLTLVMVISGAFMLPADGHKALANDTENGYRVEEVKMSSMSKNELPVCQDTSKEWLFAGWYKDANCETAYTSYPATSTAYAKFVPENVLSIKLQLKEGTGTGGADEKTNLRLVSTVDSLDYRKVGFEIYYNGAQTPIIASSSKVFKKIVASSESGVDYKYSPKVFDVESEYFVTATLINIAKTNFDKNFYIRPFWITRDGTTVYGVNRYINVNNGLSETNVNIPVKTDDKVTSPTVMLAGNTYDASVAYYDGTYTHLNINVPSKDTTLKSVSEVTVSEGDVTGKAVYRNLYSTHESGDSSKPNADTTWYDEEASTHTIATSADLYGFASLVNGGETFEDNTVYIVSDIAVNNGAANHAELTWVADGTQYGWSPIGQNDARRFAGTFDGQMHTISGICLNSSSSRSGLFGVVDENSILKNFKLTNSYFKIAGNSYVGSIVGYVYGGSIENVYSSAIVDNKNQSNGGGYITGGLVGKVDITVSDFEMNNCWFDGTVTNGDRFLGGLIGAFGEAKASTYTQTITNCLNTGSIPGTSASSRWVGGLFGYNYGTNFVMSHCLNAGTIGCINATESQKSTQYSLIGNFGYSTPKLSDTYATKQEDFLNYINKNGTVVKNTDTSVVGASAIAGSKALSVATTKNLFTYVTDADTYANESYWAIVPGKAPVLSAFADMVEGQCQAVDTSWFNKTDDTFNLKDAADLYGLSLLTRDVDNTAGFENKTILLEKDILMNEGITYNENGVVEDDTPNEWLAIGTETEPFKGDFDGNGKNISGLYLNATSVGNGLFGYTYKDVSIKNFSLTNSYFYSSASAYSDLGSIVGRAEGGSFEGIYSDANVYGRCDRIGGLIGHVEGEDDFSINNCWFDGSATVENSRDYIGGLVGHIKNEQNNYYRKVTNCLNSGDVKAINSGTTYMGGLIGLNNNGGGLTINNCLNTKEIQYAGTVNTSNLTDGKTYLYGLIAGQLNSATVVDNVFTIQQDYIPNEGYGYAFKYEPQKAIEDIFGVNAMEEMPAFYSETEVDGKAKVYWAITDATPVLADFIEFVDEDNAAVAIDTSWHNNSNSYTLYDAADLYGFAKLVNEGNDFTGKTVKLGANIAIPNSGDSTDWATEAPALEWIGIGTAETKFNGTFDGNGNEISGLYMNATKTGNGLFGYTGPDVAIKNFALTNSYFHSSASAYADLGSIVGRTEGGSFDSIYSDAIVYGACNNIGGLIGHMEGTANFSINNCWYDGDLTVANSCDNVGGLIGHVKNESGKYSRIVTNCLNSGIIKATNSGTKYMGGLIGLNNSGAGLTIEKCLNTKEIQYAGTVNTAKLTDKTTYLYGLIAGQVNTATVVNDVFTIQQDYIPNEGYGYAFKYEPQKAIDEISGTNATVNMPNLFTSQTVDGKDYWVITNETPILSSFIEYADVEQVGVYADASWYNETDDEFMLDTAGELYGLAKLCNNRVDTFDGKTIKLGSDIQLNIGVATDWENGVNLPINIWIPIGITPGTAFKGTFDGQGHTISGIYLQSSKEYVGVFGVLNQAGNATIKNLRVENSYLERTLTTWHDNYGLGSIAGQGAGTLENIYSDAILVNQGTHTGGLVGNVLYISETTPTPALVVNNCWYTGKVTSGISATEAKDDWVGGIIGRVASKATVNMTDCLVAADLNSQLQSTYLTNKEDSTSTVAGKSYIGGLSGRMGAGTIQSCLAYGSMSCISGTKSNLVGNIVRDTLKIEECYNAMGTTPNYTFGTDVNVPEENVDIITLEDRGAGNYNLVFADKSASDYASYCDDLVNKKFAKYAESSTGDENGKVYNATFVRDEIVVTVVFMKKAGEICISIEKDLPLSEHLLSKSAYRGAERANEETTLHMLGFAEGNYGDSFVLQLKNGHFIVSDGGMMSEAETLYNYLFSLTPDGEVPVIEAWFISHGHTDHIGALSTFVHEETYYKNVCVNGVYFNEPNPNGFAAQDYLSAVKRVSNFRTESNEATQIYRPQIGQRYYFDDVTIDVLHTQEQLELEEYVNTNGNEFNETSTWLMFTMDGYTFLHAGDAAQNSVNTVIENYSADYLEFDVMATLHHAQNIYTNFIDTFDYDILLYTTKNMWSQNDSASDADNGAMLSKAHYAYAWGEGTITLSFSKDNGIQIFN